tara:strand:+ start:133 stop:252 length:120 start_codon:yes stop_codon:yes gene_type:complete
MKEKLKIKPTYRKQDQKKFSPPTLEWAKDVGRSLGAVKY